MKKHQLNKKELELLRSPRHLKRHFVSSGDWRCADDKKEVISRLYFYDQLVRDFSREVDAYKFALRHSGFGFQIYHIYLFHNGQWLIRHFDCYLNNRSINGLEWSFLKSKDREDFNCYFIKEPSSKGYTIPSVVLNTPLHHTLKIETI